MSAVSVFAFVAVPLPSKVLFFTGLQFGKKILFVTHLNDLLNSISNYTCQIPSLA